MHKLVLMNSTTVDLLDTPASSRTIDLDSPALEVFTDFHQVPLVTIDQGAGVDRVRAAMLAAAPPLPSLRYQ